MNSQEYMDQSKYIRDTLRGKILDGEIDKLLFGIDQLNIKTKGILYIIELSRYEISHNKKLKMVKIGVTSNIHKRLLDYSEISDIKVEDDLLQLANNNDDIIALVNTNKSLEKDQLMVEVGQNFMKTFFPGLKVNELQPKMGLQKSIGLSEWIIVDSTICDYIRDNYLLGVLNGDNFHNHLNLIRKKKRLTLIEDGDLVFYDKFVGSELSDNDINFKTGVNVGNCNVWTLE